MKDSVWIELNFKVIDHTYSSGGSGGSSAGSSGTTTGVTPSGKTTGQTTANGAVTGTWTQTAMVNGYLRQTEPMRMNGPTSAIPMQPGISQGRPGSALMRKAL